jgi:hypothetical protein
MSRGSADRNNSLLILVNMRTVGWGDDKSGHRVGVYGEFANLSQ